LLWWASYSNLYPYICIIYNFSKCSLWVNAQFHCVNKYETIGLTMIFSVYYEIPRITKRFTSETKWRRNGCIILYVCISIVREWLLLLSVPYLFIWNNTANLHYSICYLNLSASIPALEHSFKYTFWHSLDIVMNLCITEIIAAS